jgi:rubrerythrin
MQRDGRTLAPFRTNPPLAAPPRLARAFDRLRQRPVWRDPYRKYRTLLSFSDTEEDAGKDLIRAAARIVDPTLRAHVERHAADEMRHARLFRARAAELAAEHRLPPGGAADPQRPFDLSKARPDLALDSHGFYAAGLIDELGELEYVAMLHRAEKRAADLFTEFRDANAKDAATRAVFDEILRDERYHVAYTERFLERWRAEGRGAEVDRALARSDASRWLEAWKRLGARSAAGTARVVLVVLYWTVVAPFAIASKRAVPRGWQEPRRARDGSRRFAQS